MLINDFGKEISRCQADAHLHELVVIKQNVWARFKALFAGDKMLTRFFCGKEQTEQERNTLEPNEHYCSDIAFVFDKENIRNNWEEIINGKNNGLIIFVGVRNKGTDGPCIEPDNNGKPTAMIFPYRYVNKEADPSQIEILLDNGSEHPGTGGIDRKSVV